MTLGRGFAPFTIPASLKRGASRQDTYMATEGGACKRFCENGGNEGSVISQTPLNDLSTQSLLFDAFPDVRVIAAQCGYEFLLRQGIC